MQSFNLSKHTIVIQAFIFQYGMARKGLKTKNVNKSFLNHSQSIQSIQKYIQNIKIISKYANFSFASLKIKKKNVLHFHTHAS